MQSLAEYFCYTSDAFKSPCVYSLQAYSPYTVPWRMTMLPPWHPSAQSMEMARAWLRFSASVSCAAAACATPQAQIQLRSPCHMTTHTAGRGPGGSTAKYAILRQIRSSKSLRAKFALICFSTFRSLFGLQIRFLWPMVPILAVCQGKFLRTYSIFLSRQRVHQAEEW